MPKIPWLVCSSCACLSDLLLGVLVLHGHLLHLVLDLVAVHRGVKCFCLEPPQFARRHAERVTGPTAGAHLPLLGEDILLADMAVLHDGVLYGLFRFRQLCRGVTRCGTAAGIAADCKPLASP